MLCLGAAGSEFARRLTLRTGLHCYLSYHLPEDAARTGLLKAVQVRVLEELLKGASETGQKVATA